MAVTMIMMVERAMMKVQRNLDPKKWVENHQTKMKMKYPKAKNNQWTTLSLVVYITIYPGLMHGFLPSTVWMEVYQFIILGQAYCEVKHHMYWVVANSENPLPRGKWLELQQVFLEPSSVNSRVEWLSSPSRIAISQTSGIWGAPFYLSQAWWKVLL